MTDPVPLVDFRYDAQWTGDAPYGKHGEDVTGLHASCTFAFEDGRSVAVDAEGTFARPYEPFQRGGLNLMQVRTDDGRTGHAICEVTGSRHDHFFPDTDVTGTLPS